MTSEPDGVSPDQRTSGVVAARLLIGLIVLVCAEVFSGASLGMGIWNPFVWTMTYWLYFAHFFFFTTLAVRTGRTSFWSLYLWGVLFGLYESWITKVIWYGYGGDGKLALGHFGPYGFAELSMAFIFHPVMSFLLPLAVACLLCPPLRRLFPDLAWFTGKSLGARLVQVYLVFSLAPIVGMNSGGPNNSIARAAAFFASRFPILGINSGGPVNLALNVALIIGLLWSLSRLARTALAAPGGRSIVVFGRWGFVGLCLYLALLYGLTYFFLRPEGLPSVRVQLLTVLMYALVILGLRLHRPREPLAGDAVDVEPRELRLAMAVFAWVIGLGFVFSFVAPHPYFFVPFALNSVVWTVLGFLLTGIALWQGVSEFRDPRAGSHGFNHEGGGSSNLQIAGKKNALDDPNPCVP